MKIRLQHLIGAVVRDRAGVRVGRIESVQARREGMHCFVFEYHVGPAAFLAKLGIGTGRLFGFRRGESLRIPWQQLDITDERNPRLLCTRQELHALQ